MKNLSQKRLALKAQEHRISGGQRRLPLKATVGVPALALVLMGAASAPAFADHRGAYTGYESGYTHAPFTIYVDLDTKRGRNKNEHILQEKIEAGLRSRLPGNIQFAHSARAADYVIRLDELSYDYQLRRTDVDYEDKSYKGKYQRISSGRCGLASKAYYTEVENKGTGYYNYAVNSHIKGHAYERDYLQGQTSYSYKYATDLKAQTVCGLRPTDHAPSSKVARLLEQSSPEYANSVRYSVRADAAYELGQDLAPLVISNINHYWDGYYKPAPHKGGNHGYKNGHKYGKGHDKHKDAPVYVPAPRREHEHEDRDDRAKRIALHAILDVVINSQK